MPPDGLPAGFSFQEDDSGIIDQVFDFVDVSSVAGISPLRYTVGRVKFVRRLYKVQGLSLSWFALVVPDAIFLEPTPHVYFLPAPWQGGADDSAYDQFGGAWRSTLYEDYTTYMGAQIAFVRDAQQVLVIPF